MLVRMTNPLSCSMLQGIIEECLALLPEKMAIKQDGFLDIYSPVPPNWEEVYMDTYALS